MATRLSAEAQPFIPSSGNEGTCLENSMAVCDLQSQSGNASSAIEVDGGSVTENAADPTEIYLKELQYDHAKMEMKTATFKLTKQGIPRSDLPAPKGPVVTLSEKLVISAKKYPEYNFVGRILVPRGVPVKQLEQETGYKINAKGCGIKKEFNEQNKIDTEHVAENTEEEELYVLVSCQDTGNRAALKLKRAVDELQRILTSSNPKFGELNPPNNFNALENAREMQEPPIGFAEASVSTSDFRKWWDIFGQYLNPPLSPILPSPKEMSQYGAAVTEPVFPAFPQGVKRNEVLLVLENDGTGSRKKTKPHPIPSGKKTHKPNN